MATLEIPLDSSVAIFSQVVSLSGTPYVLEFDWDDRTESWFMDLYLQTDTDPEPIRTSIRLAVDWPLLVGVVHDSRPPGELQIIDSSNAGPDPGRNDLGTRCKLYYFTDD